MEVFLNKLAKMPEEHKGVKVSFKRSLNSHIFRSTGSVGKLEAVPLSKHRMTSTTNIPSSIV